jgi:tetratricopeptide (TPR) repeat protein
MSPWLVPLIFAVLSLACILYVLFLRRRRAMNALSNLGNLYLAQGELDKAEEMYRKALEIDKRLGLQEGMAIDYGNLGEIEKDRGNIATAREDYNKALDFYRKIGMPHMVSKVQGWLDKLEKTPPHSDASK